MNEITLRRLQDLRQCIKEDGRMLALSQAEKAMLQDPEVKRLYEEKENARVKYLTLRLEAGEEAPETLQAREELRLKEIELNEKPSAKEYSARFSDVRFLMQEVDGVLFGPFRVHSTCGGRHGKD